VLVDYIDRHRDQFGVEPICRVLRHAGMQIAPSTYYAAMSRAPSARSVSDQTRLEMIRQVHAENYGVYGAPMRHLVFDLAALGAQLDQSVTGGRGGGLHVAASERVRRSVEPAG
jgi:hypothetical protein